MTRKLTAKLATETWARRGLLDIYFAFYHSHFLNYRLFFYQQGIEKLCKAYLVATQAIRYEHLQSNAAGKWIDEFVKTLEHDISLLLGLVAIGVNDIRIYQEDMKFVDLLNRFYLEGRYPIPIGRSSWEKHGFPAIVSSDLDEKAEALATVLWDSIDAYLARFGHRLSIPIRHPLNDAIDKADWERFMNIWEKRRQTNLKWQIKAAN